jgi:FixJ family two-component response regulator
MNSSATILFVDDEPFVLDAIRRIFAHENCQLLCASSGSEALEYLERSVVQVVVSDFRMPGMSGGELMGIVTQRWPDVVRIILSGFADLPSVIASINDGQIYKFVSKPWNNEELKTIVRAAVEKHRQQTELRALAEAALSQNESLMSANADNMNSISQRNIYLEEQNEQLVIYWQLFMKMSIPAFFFREEKCREMNESALCFLEHEWQDHSITENHPFINQLAKIISQPETAQAQNIQVKLTTGEKERTLNLEKISLGKSTPAQYAMFLLRERNNAATDS